MFVFYKLTLIFVKYTSPGHTSSHDF